MLDTLFPPRCLLCGAAGGPAGPAADGAAPACAACRAELPWLVLSTQTAPREWSSGTALSALSYEYPVDRLIAAAKFGRQVPVARGLGQLLDLAMPALPEAPDAVVPVPLHWRRETQRGFNQAEEIARALCQARHWPLRADWCRRLRPTPEQSGLGAAERARNLRGAFALRADAQIGQCRHALIVDDVLTTGATAAAVARALQAAGIVTISLWTVARTPEPGG